MSRMMTKMRAKWSRWIKRCLASVIGLCSAIALTEFALRVLGVSYPVFYQADDFCGVRLRNGASGFQSTEGCAYVTVNEQGWRGLSPDLESTRHEYLSVAVLGDSYMEAMQVDYDKSFCALLEMALCKEERSFPYGVRIWNFGVSGYGTTQELETLINYVPPYKPDVVLLALMTGNDIRNNSKELNRELLCPYYVRSANGYKISRDYLESPMFRWRKSALASVMYSISDWSRLVQLINHVKNSVRDNAPLLPTVDGGLDYQVYCPPEDHLWREAWATTEFAVIRMRDTVQKMGARFGIIVLSNPTQVHPDDNVRKGFVDSHPGFDLFYPDHRVAAFASEHSIPCLLLAPAMQERARLTHKHLHGFGRNIGGGHWNENGHNVAAGLVATWFRAVFIEESSTKPQSSASGLREK